MNDMLYLVQSKKNTFLFDKSNFLKFINKNADKDWSFAVGFLNSYDSFVSSTELTTKQFEKIFNIEEIKPLLKYRKLRFGNKTMYDCRFFNQLVYERYGEQRK